jgi:hypothetical protein
MAFQNLKAEMSRYGVTQVSIAKHLGMSTNNFHEKLCGRVRFTIPEAFSIRDEFFPRMNIDYLFCADGCELEIPIVTPGTGEQLGTARLHPDTQIVENPDDNDILLFELKGTRTYSDTPGRESEVEL